MLTVPGIYENGKIQLLHEVPTSIKQKVLVTFIEEDENETIRAISLNQDTEEIQSYLRDPGEDLYQDYLTKNNK